MNKDNLNLDKEVENIIKSNGFKIPRDVLDNLVKKYDSRIVENITSLVNKRYKEMINMSIKLADKLINSGNDTWAGYNIETEKVVDDDDIMSSMSPKEKLKY